MACVAWLQLDMESLTEKNGERSALKHSPDWVNDTPLLLNSLNGFSLSVQKPIFQQRSMTAIVFYPQYVFEWTVILHT